MNNNHLKNPREFEFGYTSIAELNGKRSEMLMDFGIARLAAGEQYACGSMHERAFLLVYGEVKLEWGDKSAQISRANCFDVAPWALHVPQGVMVKITGVAPDSELAIMGTPNSTEFESKLYSPEDTPDEYRGAGTMRETSTRIVRTIFDKSNAPYANLVLGEVIGFPGKWSSYPPHHHPQPEIYYYKHNPSNGFSYAELGEEVVKVHSNDVTFVTEGLTHPQSAAPGYALWYLWAIRHLEGNPYITPTFVPEHLWVTEKDAPIWPPEKP